MQRTLFKPIRCGASFPPSIGLPFGRAGLFYDDMGIGATQAEAADTCKA